MDMKQRTYIAIDLKSFYASVECVERGLDPLNTNLVVADTSRTEKTICLAVSPSLKAYGIGGRARLFEVIQKVSAVNKERERLAPAHVFSGTSCMADELSKDPSLRLDFIAATPQMAHYMDFSTKIYEIYLRYVSSEDIHVYSIDEVFIDATPYLGTYGLTAHAFAMKLVKEVLKETGITATAGIGTNLYLAKIAMDIEAKHVEADQDGVRIAELDEMSYRQKLWDHTPLTDFWRVGRGYARKLNENGLYTMGDVARCSIGGERDFYNEDLLYRLFGVQAELLIDHAWGYEPCTIEQIKAYKPSNNSFSSGQVLSCPHTWEQTRLIVKEMIDLQALELVEKRLVTDQVVLTIDYDIANMTDPKIRQAYKGPIATDWYGRRAPRHAHGTQNLEFATASSRLLTKAVLEIFDRITDPILLTRRITICVNHVVPEDQVTTKKEFEQLSLFTDYEAQEKERKNQEQTLAREKKMQQAMIDIKKKYGKNAILKGMNLQEGATAMERNRQIGGHKA